MTVLRWDELVTPRSASGSGRSSLNGRPVRITIGVFDGLHLGHRRLLEGIVTGGKGAVSTVLTFRETPAMVLAPASFPGFILTWPQKLARLASLGIEAVVVIDFSREMSNLSGKAFIGLLKEKFALQKIVVGHNFRFGKSRDSGADDLKEMLSGTGTEVQVSEPVLWGGGIVSSSRIRQTIREAHFADARAMLGADFGLDVSDLPVRKISEGRLSIGRADVKQVLPARGTYDATFEGPAGSCPGKVTIGESSLILAAAGCGDTTNIVFQ